MKVQVRAVTFPVGIATRHVRLSQSHLHLLFGSDARLTPLAPLSQPADVACMETLTVRGPAGSLAHVRIIGPLQARTTVELSARDAVRIGLHAAERVPKDDAAQGCVLEGPKGTLVLADGVSTSLRNLQCSPADAARLGIQETAFVSVHVAGDRTRVLRDVPVRIRPQAKLELHVELEDANSLDLHPETPAMLVS